MTVAPTKTRMASGKFQSAAWQRAAAASLHGDPDLGVRGIGRRPEIGLRQGQQVQNLGEDPHRRQPAAANMNPRQPRYVTALPQPLQQHRNDHLALAADAVVGVQVSQRGLGEDAVAGLGGPTQRSTTSTPTTSAPGGLPHHARGPGRRGAAGAKREAGRDAPAGWSRGDAFVGNPRVIEAQMFKSGQPSEVLQPGVCDRGAVEE